MSAEKTKTQEEFSMRKTKFQRITALLLALVFLMSGAAISTAAASSDKTTEEIRALLNAISYKEYAATHSSVDKATEELVIDATKGYTYVAQGGAVYKPETQIPEGVDKKNVAYVGEFDGKNALYTPSTGTVTWNLAELFGDKVATAKKYAMVVEYYPIENKSAAIERIFMLNGKVPFSEARGLSISKIWKNVYEDGSFEVPKGESAQSYIDAAQTAGISAKSEDRDGKTYIIYTMPEFWTSETANIVNEKLIRFFQTDIDLNEIRASLVQAPAWSEYYFKDANGFMQDSFEFVVAPDEDTGEVTLSIESVNEPMVISKIRLVSYKGPMSYADYSAKFENVGAGTDKIKIEAEYYSAASTQTIYPVSDATSAITSPSSAASIMLNTVGGDKWQSPGQWIEYKFKVNSSGMYKIATRFMQNVLDGMYTSRALYIYSDSTVAPESNGYYNGIPFAEAGRLQFDYSSDWQSGMLTDGVQVDGNDRSFDIYFEAGVEYTIRFEVTLGNMGKIVSDVQSSLESINADYLNILKLTGSNPDDNRDYYFSRVMPDTVIDLTRQKTVLIGDESRNIKGISQILYDEAGVKSSMTATLDKIGRLLGDMGSDDDLIAKNLGQLKTYIGSLGTWLTDAKTQPLILDYLVIQPANDAELPVAKAGFFKALWFEVRSFFQSFFRNYSRMGTMDEINEDNSVEVWLAYGRDQSQVIRGLINNDFTPSTGVAIDLKLVAASTLLPSILSGMGPDVYIGVNQNDTINYAIRGALVAIDGMEDFDEVVKNFKESAMLVLGTEGRNESTGEVEFHYYGLPETQSFSMMFVREDIFAELGLEIPKTWDDVKEAIPILQSNNMQIGMIRDENIFLYQMGGDLFADDGMRINLDSNVALDAFNTMTEMFTMYSFPYQYDFPNRFRTGEMPIGFAQYTATYNQLKVFATEIEGLWSFYPLPGYAQEDGTINNASVSTVAGISMINGCDDTNGAWEFIKWYAGEQCQVSYANEMVALLGPSAKHPTANISALASLPWTDAELKQLEDQFDKLAAIPNYPGRYIVERYTQFAFLAAFNDRADPVTEMQSYIKTINTEITRKREEFGLETLADGQTLAQKRMAQAEEKLAEARSSAAYSSAYDETCGIIEALLKDYVTEDYASLRSLAKTLEELNAELFAGAASDMRSAANALETYEDYK